MKRIFLLSIVLLMLATSFSIEAAVVRARDGTFYGLSTDTKPTSEINEGTRFYEYDTNRTFIWGGVSWSIYGRGYTTNPDTTVAKGSSLVYSASGFSGFTVIADVADVNTNLIVYIESKATDSGWAVLPSPMANLTNSASTSRNDSTLISTNGTYIWKFSCFIDSVRATVSAGSGETTFRAVWRWVFGNN